MAKQGIEFIKLTRTDSAFFHFVGLNKYGHRDVALKILISHCLIEPDTRPPQQDPGSSQHLFPSPVPGHLF